MWATAPRQVQGPLLLMLLRRLPARRPAFAAAAAGSRQLLPHEAGTLGAPCLAWSAALGDQQVPWGGMLRAFGSHLSGASGGSDGAAAAGTGVEAAPPSTAGAALNFDDAPEAPRAGGPAAAPADSQPQPQQQSQQQQQQELALRLPASVCASGAFSELLPLVVSRAELLQPWQAAPLPSLDDLARQERLKLSGAQKSCRISQEAFAERTQLLKRFERSAALHRAARGAQLPKSVLSHAAAAFRKFLHRSSTPGLTASLLIAAAQQQQQPAAAAAAAPGAAPPPLPPPPPPQQQQLPPALLSYTPAVEELLSRYFVEFCRQQYRQEIESYAAAVATLDLRHPHKWYPYARALQRKIIYHGGPTNSGKTYSALQSLAAAPRGVYCAPLRLLAMEVYETLNHRGVYCDLVTGQEVLRVPGSGHVACTVEMAGLATHADVAVIDEIQLIGDDQRGFAWSRALLGLPANTIHVCGDTSAVGLVRHLAALCGDEFELRTYERMTPLRVDEAGLPNGWADVQPGDAVVAFSRKSIYTARKAIEAATDHRTCIVYGALPAETRRHQARLFNEPHSGVDVLVASDAIGLGLNFNIRRVIFTTMKKSSRGGRGQVPVPVSLVKQIAGRAGRRNSIYPEGCVTTLRPQDLPALRRAIATPMDRLHTPAAGLAPEYETVELLSAQFPDLSLEQLLRKLDSEARLDGRFFLCRQEQLLETAWLLSEIKGLSLADQFTLVNAPIDPFDPRQRRAFADFVGTFALGRPVIFNEALMPPGPPSSEAQMGEAESLHKILGLWLWLSFRFDEWVFPGRERVQALARRVSHYLNVGLSSIQAAAVQEAAARVASAAAAAEAAAGGGRPGGEAGEEGGREGPSAGGEEDGADSTDADEVNQAVFNTPVVEADETAAAAAAGAAAAAAADTVGAALQEQQQQQQQQPRRRGAQSKPQRQEPVVYIAWGRTVASDLGPSAPPGHGAGAGAAAGARSGSGSDEEAAAGHDGDRALQQLLASEPALAAGDGSGAHSVEVLERLLMPEFEPSMAPFVWWRSRPRFVPGACAGPASAVGGDGGSAVAAR